MFPYVEEFILDKIREYNEVINKNIKNNFKIVVENISNQVSGYMYTKKTDFNINIFSLFEGDHKIMDISPREIEASYVTIKRAYGKVGVVGLGLGYVVRELVKNPKVSKVIVYESSKEVIDLYRKNFKTHPKIKIIHGDAYKAKKDSFDFFYVDIYEYNLSERVVFDYKYFNELHNIEDYTFCGMEHFLLSCSYDDLLHVYLPDGWLDASRDYFKALESSGYLDYYYELDSDTVEKVLTSFTKVLND